MNKSKEIKTTKSVWDNISFNTKKINTFKILKEQASELSDKTNGLLYAEVNPIDAFEEGTLEKGIVFNFYVYAPYLGNVRVLIFSVLEKIKDQKLQIIDKFNNSAIIDIKDHEHLIAEISNIIKTKNVNEFLSNWYSSSYNLKKNNNSFLDSDRKL